MTTLTRKIQQTTKSLTNNYEELSKEESGPMSSRSKSNRPSYKIKGKRQKIRIKTTCKAYGRKTKQGMPIKGKVPSVVDVATEISQIITDLRKLEVVVSQL